MSASPLAPPAARPGPAGILPAFLRHRSRTFPAGVALFALIVLLLVLGPWIAPHDPAAQNLVLRLRPPSAANWLGTDEFGRDLLSRLLTGGQFALAVAALTLILCAGIGTLAGMACARAGGLADEACARAVDALVAFPDVIVAIFVIAVFGSGAGTVVVALTVVGWTPFARLARSLTIAINARDYIAAAEALGSRRRVILLHHVLPNVIRPLAALAFLRFGHKLIAVGGLSYLGLGVQPPRADWALMLASAPAYAERAPLLVIAPGLAIFLTALSVTWIGQGLEPRKTDGWTG